MATGQIEVRTSVCPLDCPDTCSLDVHVRDGRVLSLDGGPGNSITGGFICGKVRHFPERMYGSERLLSPAIRTGNKGAGEFRDVSWDEALNRIVAAINNAREEFGGEAILPFSYGGSNGFLTHGSIDERLFRRLGASRLARTVCAAPTGAALAGMYGKMAGVSFEDYPCARLIILWGANPSASNIHLVPYLRQAQQAGAKLVVIDPRATPVARSADLHLALRPGTDLPVALSLINWLFTTGRADQEFLAAHTTGGEELRRRAAEWTLERAATVAGVSHAELERLARWYADAEPALVRCGWGLERNRNGGSAVAAVLALPAVAGKFGVRGGGFTLSNSAAWDFDLQQVAAEPESSTRVVNMNRLGRALAELDAPPIKLLFVYNANPVATLPMQSAVCAGMERDDLFTVVFDQVMTDTARYADVILPATTFLEHHELRRSYGALRVQQAHPVAEPAGEARPNYEVFAELIERLVLARDGDPRSPEELRAAALAGLRNGEDVQEILAADGAAPPACGSHPVQMVDVRPTTADGKVHLVPQTLDRAAGGAFYSYRDDPGSERFPLALISPATSKAVNSSLWELESQIIPIEISPDDAAARGIRNGDTVRVFNGLGEVVSPARIDPHLRAGVVSIPKGLWRRHTRNGWTANALASDDYTDVAEGACFNDARVQVARIEE